MDLFNAPPGSYYNWAHNNVINDGSAEGHQDLHQFMTQDGDIDLNGMVMPGVRLADNSGVTTGELTPADIDSSLPSGIQSEHTSTCPSMDASSDEEFIPEGDRRGAYEDSHSLSGSFKRQMQVDDVRNKRPHVGRSRKSSDSTSALDEETKRLEKYSCVYTLHSHLL